MAASSSSVHSIKPNRTIHHSLTVRHPAIKAAVIIGSIQQDPITKSDKQLLNCDESNIIDVPLWAFGTALPDVVGGVTGRRGLCCVSQLKHSPDIQTRQPANSHRVSQRQGCRLK